MSPSGNAASGPSGTFSFLLAGLSALSATGATTGAGTAESSTSISVAAGASTTGVAGFPR